MIDPKQLNEGDKILCLESVYEGDIEEVTAGQWYVVQRWVANPFTSVLDPCFILRCNTGNRAVSEEHFHVFSKEQPVQSTSTLDIMSITREFLGR